MRGYKEISINNQSTKHHSIQTTNDAFYARDMTEALEGIVRHYTGHLDLDKATVVHIARSLRHQSQRADGRD